MNRLILAAVAVVALMPRPALAHRLDEYLQATILSLNGSSVTGTIRLVPGVAVSSAVIADIDIDKDGVLSQTEKTAYVQTVLNDITLKVDDEYLPIHSTSASFPTIQAMLEGNGEIVITFKAQFSQSGHDRQLILENHHRPQRSVYLVNVLVPESRDIQIESQTRSKNQSLYQLNFHQAFANSSRTDVPTLSGFAGAFRLGNHHIAEGTDHLLFIFTLMLPATLLASAGRWKYPASTKHSLLQILRVVTAFTVGHSLTLALSAFGILSIPGKPVEVLIAVSILISAVHAIRPLFPGHEAVVAAAFGLIHGLAFASALNDLGVSGWYRIVSLAGFNLGIEAMQLVVVAAVLPSLLMAGRTSFYSLLRIVGGASAALLALLWILQDTLNLATGVDLVASILGRNLAWLALGLLLFSIAVRITSHRKKTIGTSHPSPDCYFRNRRKGSKPNTSINC